MKRPVYSFTLMLFIFTHVCWAVDDYDPLFGNGNVNRSALTYDSLINGVDPGNQVDMSSFGLPINAAQPNNNFEGRLTLLGEASGGEFFEIKDTFGYTSVGDTTRKHLPEFDYTFVQTGTHIVPLERGSLANSHPQWEYILEPGRVWQENGDNGYSRAAIPFTLQQKNANCMHNGVISFLFKNDGTISQVAYQISSETCLYFKFDMWGLLSASYTPAIVANAVQIKTAYQAEVAVRMPSKPISALANDYSGADPSQFGNVDETAPAHMTLYGFVIDGTHYVGGCETRYGTYPYCEVMDIPSFSTAKSAFAGVALMRLEKKYPGSMSQSIANYVPDCAINGFWFDVTFENAADMSTGNYDSPFYMGDEFAWHTSYLFLPEQHVSKIGYACNIYIRKAIPGSQWVYHTSDTYILGTAMNTYVKRLEGSSADIFSTILVEELWKPLGISPAARVSRRTYDSIAQPFTGWGLTFHRDDVSKITEFLNLDHGVINGQPMLDSAQLNAAMQRTPLDRGLTPLYGYQYNNGFWAHEISGNLACVNEVWVPFMSGYGGISIVMLPNGSSYYFFSDNDTYSWMKAAVEANKIRNFCS